VNFGERLYEYIFESSKWCFVWGAFNLAKVVLFHRKLKKKWGLSSGRFKQNWLLIMYATQIFNRPFIFWLHIEYEM
jgi:hypothetical protein